MKKSTAITAVAKLAASLAAITATIASAQASAYQTMSGVTGTNAKDYITAARRQLDEVNHVTKELIDMINSEHAGDPLSMDGFDIDETGGKLCNAGLITDYDTWTNAASIIEADGFVAYLEELKSRFSTLDKKLTAASDRIGAWLALDSGARMTAVAKNTDNNPVPTLAKLKADLTKFDHFAQAGILVFAELSYADADAGSIVSRISTNKAGAKSLSDIST